MISFENLEERFQHIKEMAYRRNTLPSYQGENAYSDADEHYFYAMKYIYDRYKLRQIHKDEAEKEVETLKLKFISAKQSEDARARSYREFDDTRQKAGQWTKELIAYEGKSQKEIFELLFCRLIPALTNEVAGKKIKEGAGYFLMTGESNLTDEEREELKKRYA